MSLDDLPTLTSFSPELAGLEQQLSFQGHWLPLYLEPIVGSGERLVFAIAARGEDGQTVIERVIPRRVLQAFYGAKAKRLGDMLSLVEERVLAAISAGNLTPAVPLAGFFIGPARRSRGRSIKDLVTQGRISCASLGAVSEDASEAMMADEDERQTSRWADRVKAHVLITAKDLGPFFQRSVALQRTGIPVHYGYFDGRYMAHFGVIRRDNPAGSLYHLNARLWQLAAAGRDLLSSSEQRELLLARPNLASATLSMQARERITDVIDLLEADAGRYGIGIMHTEKVEEASSHLYSQARRLAA